MEVAKGRGGANNPTGRNQYAEVNPRVDLDSPTEPDPPIIPIHDRRKEPQAGDSIGYAIRRLHRAAGQTVRPVSDCPPLRGQGRGLSRKTRDPTPVPPARDSLSHPSWLTLKAYAET
jgi:hypothetical protein